MDLACPCMPTKAASLPVKLVCLVHRSDRMQSISSFAGAYLMKTDICAGVKLDALDITDPEAWVRYAAKYATLPPLSAQLALPASAWSKQEEGASREARVAIRLAALGRPPQRMEMGKGGNRRPKGDAIVAQATDLSRQRNAYQGVLMGIDLGHGVHDAGRAKPWSAAVEAACQEEAPGAEAEGQAGSVAQCC